MTTDTLHNVLRVSWSRAVTDPDALARLFYAKLFALAPETEDLFQADMAAQGRKLIATLSFVIDNIDDQQILHAAAGELALRHLDYNVSADQYEPVGIALIETLKDLLGSSFDNQAETAWRETYAALSEHMVRTAYP